MENISCALEGFTIIPKTYFSLISFEIYITFHLITETLFMYMFVVLSVPEYHDLSLILHDCVIEFRKNNICYPTEDE